MKKKHLLHILCFRGAIALKLSSLGVKKKVDVTVSPRRELKWRETPATATG